MASPTSCLCGSGVSAPVNAKTDALLAVTLRHALTGFNHTCQGAVHDHIQIVVTDRAKVRLIHLVKKMMKSTSMNQQVGADTGSTWYYVV